MGWQTFLSTNLLYRGFREGDTFECVELLAVSGVVGSLTTGTDANEVILTRYGRLSPAVAKSMRAGRISRQETSFRKFCLGDLLSATDSV